MTDRQDDALSGFGIRIVSAVVMLAGAGCHAAVGWGGVLLAFVTILLIAFGRAAYDLWGTHDDP